MAPDFTGSQGLCYAPYFQGENRHPRAWALAHLASALRFSGKTLKTALQSESAGQRHKPGQPKGSMERDEILARLRERIVAFSASRISKEAAEDLAQEVLIVLHEKYAHVTDLSELLPFSLQVLRWKMLALHRKSVRRRVLGRNGCARRTRAGGLSLAPLESGA